MALRYTPRSAVTAAAELSRQLGTQEREKATLTGESAKIRDSLMTVSAASFDFPTLESTYTNLLIRASLRGTSATLAVGAQLRFNNDTAANYDDNFFYATGTTPAAGEHIGATSGYIGDAPANNAVANARGYFEILVPRYTDSERKTAHFHYHYRHSITAGNGLAMLGQVDWRSTAVINQVTISVASGLWATFSRVQVFGVT